MAKKAKKSGNKILGFIFFALVVVGLVLTIVGMCVDVVTKTDTLAGKVVSTTYIKLFGDEWEGFSKLEITRTVVPMIAFIVTIVGLAVLALDAVLRVFLGKDVKIVRIVGVALSIVGAILILVAGLVVVGALNDKLGVDGSSIKSGIKYSAAAGIWLGFVGGLVGGVCGALPLFKQFN